MTDREWYESVKSEEDAGWHLVWDRVIAPEAASMRSGEMMKRYSLTDGDLMGMLYDDMISKRKIELFRGEGSFEGWLRSYVRGYVLNANPRKHDEISIDGAGGSEDGESEAMTLPDQDREVIRSETWRLTHYCFRELWNEDPERCYVHVLKTRFFLTSEEVSTMLGVSSAANVDQIFSRSVKFMREAWRRNDRGKG